MGTAQEADEPSVSAGSAPGDSLAAPWLGGEPGHLVSSAGKPLPISPSRRVPVQAAGAVPPSIPGAPLLDHHSLLLSASGAQQFAAATAAASLGLQQRCCSSLSGEGRPDSPTELASVLAVASVPPPPAPAPGHLMAYCLPQSAGVVAAASATAAMHHHRGILLHPQPSLFSAASPFAGGLYLG